MVKRIRANIPMVKDAGGLGFSDLEFTDIAQLGIPTYVARAALEWNTKVNVDDVLDDFYSKWFGPAAALLVIKVLAMFRDPFSRLYRYVSDRLAVRSQNQALNLPHLGPPYRAIFRRVQTMTPDNVIPDRFQVKRCVRAVVALVIRYPRPCADPERAFRTRGFFPTRSRPLSRGCYHATTS